jgi:hypothetical protein
MLLALCLLSGQVGVAAAQPTPEPPLLDVSVRPDGHFEIRTHAPDLTFAGEVGQPVSEIRATDRQDGLGSFHQVEFSYAGRGASIRAYARQSIVLFTATYTTGGPNSAPFPTLTSLPALPFTLSYESTPFSPYLVNRLAQTTDSPWLFADAAGTSVLISPATTFLNARLTKTSSGLSSGIDPVVTSLPAGFSYQTILSFGTSPNRVFETWGQALLTLHGKTRPANDADLTLEKFGYWTDNGAVYYYRYEPDLGYPATLLAVKGELDGLGLPPAYLQLDSWWYPKGPGQRWDDRDNGIYRYRAASDLFPQGLAAFQQQLGLPLVTHARWIDPTSPLRSEFAFSGNVMTDQRYWADLMDYLHDGGVVTYEQDWLGAQAQPIYDLTAPTQFMGGMADAAAGRGITLQYCMALPRHLLQSLEYHNVTTARVSDDRFDRNRWDTFLYTSRFASAIGLWPWADVFLSSERNNLVLADLSAGVVGVGDGLGQFDAGNLRRVMRADGVLIKPDAPLVPTDESMLAELAQPSSQAATGKPPMVAWTYSDLAGGRRAAYVFSYGRGNGPQSTSFSPASFGINEPVYVYDAYGDRAVRVEGGQRYDLMVDSGSYYVVTPIGPSGIALLGDAGAFVSLGRKRISDVTDDGRLQTHVEFAIGEATVTLQGFAPQAPLVTSADGQVGEVTYDSGTQRFHVDVHPATTSGPSRVTVSFVTFQGDQP